VSLASLGQRRQQGEVRWQRAGESRAALRRAGRRSRPRRGRRPAPSARPYAPRPGHRPAPWSASRAGQLGRRLQGGVQGGVSARSTAISLVGFAAGIAGGAAGVPVDGTAAGRPSSASTLLRSSATAGSDPVAFPRPQPTARAQALLEIVKAGCEGRACRLDRGIATALAAAWTDCRSSAGVGGGGMAAWPRQSTRTCPARTAARSRCRRTITAVTRPMTKREYAEAGRHLDRRRHRRLRRRRRRSCVAQMACPCTPASASGRSRPARPGGSAAPPRRRLNGNLPSGARRGADADGGDAAQGIGQARFAHQLGELRCCAGREEGRASSARACRAAVRIGQHALRARIVEREAAHVEAMAAERLARSRRRSTPEDMTSGPAFGSSRWRTSPTRAAPSPARRWTALKPNPSAVARWCRRRQDRPAALLARFASARRPLALVSRKA